MCVGTVYIYLYTRPLVGNDVPFVSISLILRVFLEKVFYTEVVAVARVATGLGLPFKGLVLVAKFGGKRPFNKLNNHLLDFSKGSRIHRTYKERVKSC